MNGRKALNRTIDEKQVFIKMMKYCTYRERAESEVMKKLRKYDLSSDSENRIVEKLSEEGFVNDLRFARIYALSKFRNNHWGRFKIRLGLKEKDINTHYIDEALREIDPEEYNATIEKLIRSKNRSIKDNDDFIRKNKIARYLVSKGFENELVWEGIQNVLK